MRYMRILLAALLLILISVPSAADIYRWVDAGGGVHYTDDPSLIPAPFREKATRTLREAPPVSVIPGPPPGPGAPGVPPGPAGGGPPPIPTDRETLLQEIEQARAMIEAKENHIRAVDEKRSLATNPLRNRVVDPADLELYEKYRVELPEDRERLLELEAAVR